MRLQSLFFMVFFLIGCKTVYIRQVRTLPAMSFEKGQRKDLEIFAGTWRNVLNRRGACFLLKGDQVWRKDLTTGEESVFVDGITPIYRYDHSKTAKNSSKEDEIDKSSIQITQLIAHVGIYYGKSSPGTICELSILPSGHMMIDMSDRSLDVGISMAFVKEREVYHLPKLDSLDPNLRRKAEVLIAKLGAESFRERHKAKSALIAMEPAIIPLLESHTENEEPEVREVIPQIICSLLAKLDITIPDLNLTLVTIKPGSFMMGSKNGGEDEEPVHHVRLTQLFWMGSTEVTQVQYKTIMGKNPSKFNGSNSPVEQVSWDNAVEFCNRLTRREHKAGRLPPNQEYRLPTETEWEYCCRSGSTTSYCFGDDESKLARYAWYETDSAKRTHPVAQKKPNFWRLYDMHGNVWEWCGGWYGDYPSDAQHDPIGNVKGTHRVLRGGGWISSDAGCRSADRIGRLPSYRKSHIGFRIVRAYCRGSGVI